MGKPKGGAGNLAPDRAKDPALPALYQRRSALSIMQTRNPIPGTDWANNVAEFEKVRAGPFQGLGDGTGRARPVPSRKTFALIDFVDPLVASRMPGIRCVYVYPAPPRCTFGGKTQLGGTQSSFRGEVALAGVFRFPKRCEPSDFPLVLGRN